MKKVYKILFIILLLMVFLLPTQAQANSFKLNVKADKTTINPGETVVLTLNLSDIDAGDLGINTVEGVLDYDNTIFEEITSDSITSLNNWSMKHNEEETEYKGKFILVTLQDGVTENQDIAKITFRVKNGVENKNTSIKIKNILSNDGNTLIEETDKEVKFEVGTVVDDSEEDDEKNEILNITNTVTQNKIEVEHENLSTGKLPQTGDSTLILWVAGITLIIASSIVYIRYKKISK